MVFWLPNIATTPADGGDEIRILEDVYLSNFDVKQQGVYYVSQEAQTGTQFLFLFFDFARKKTKHIGTTRNSVQWGFTVSPDERWILFTQGTRDVRADLMLFVAAAFLAGRGLQRAQAGLEGGRGKHPAACGDDRRGGLTEGICRGCIEGWLRCFSWCSPDPGSQHPGRVIG